VSRRRCAIIAVSRGGRGRRVDLGIPGTGRPPNRGVDHACLDKSLVRCGARLDGRGAKEMWMRSSRRLSHGERAPTDRLLGQRSLFERGGDALRERARSPATKSRERAAAADGEGEPGGVLYVSAQPDLNWFGPGAALTDAHWRMSSSPRTAAEMVTRSGDRLCAQLERHGRRRRRRWSSCGSTRTDGPGLGGWLSSTGLAHARECVV